MHLERESGYLPGTRIATKKVVANPPADPDPPAEPGALTETAPPALTGPAFSVVGVWNDLGQPWVAPNGSTIGFTNAVFAEAAESRTVKWADSQGNRPAGNTYLQQNPGVEWVDLTITYGKPGFANRVYTARVEFDPTPPFQPVLAGYMLDDENQRVEVGGEVCWGPPFGNAISVADAMLFPEYYDDVQASYSWYYFDFHNENAVVEVSANRSYAPDNAVFAATSPNFWMMFAATYASEKASATYTETFTINFDCT